MKHYLTILLVVCISINSFSQTQLPALFSDNMVLQQQESASIWGTDNPRTKITVSGSWGKNAKATTDDKRCQPGAPLVHDANLLGIPDRPAHRALSCSCRPLEFSILLLL